MPGSYPALRAAIDADPTLAGLSDAATAAALGASVGVPWEVPSVALLKLGATGLRKTIEDNLGNADPARASVALTVRDMIVSGKALDLTDPSIYSGDTASPGLLEGLIGWGWITAEQYAAIVAAGTRTTTRAEAIAGWDRPAGAGDVARARSL